MSYAFLLAAIVSEVVATTALKATNGFTVLVPSLVTIVGYAAAFYFLSLTLKTMPIGIAYAIWSGLGIIAVSLIALFLYRQTLDGPALIGMGLIIAGVLVINLFSRSASH